MKYKLKRNHLINYEVSEEELEWMLDMDETKEQEQEYIAKSKKRPRMLFPKHTRCDNDDFNSLATGKLFFIFLK